MPATNSTTPDIDANLPKEESKATPANVDVQVAPEHTPPGSTNQTKTASKTPPKKTPKKKPQVSQAAVTIKLQLSSRHAQRVYNRGYETAARALYVLSVMLRIYAHEQDAARVGEMADQMIDEMRQELEGEIQRMEQIAEEHGVDMDALKYTKPREYDVEITTPKVSQYLGLIRNMDRFVSLIDVLWLSGVYTDTQYNTGTYQWQRRLIKLANKIRNLSQQAMSMARNRGGEDDEQLVMALAGDSETETDTSTDTDADGYEHVDAADDADDKPDAAEST